MDDVKIRVAMLDPYTRQRIKKLSIGKVEKKIIDCLWGGAKTSYEVGAMLDIAVNSASTQLKRLMGKGYVRRVEVKSISGGVEFNYFNIYTDKSTDA
jgi:predicted transcriptional regulator